MLPFRRLTGDCYVLRRPSRTAGSLGPRAAAEKLARHTALDDFEHFCAYSGLTEQLAGKDGFAWAKAAYLSAWRPSASRFDEQAEQPT